MENKNSYIINDSIFRYALNKNVDIYLKHSIGWKSDSGKGTREGIFFINGEVKEFKDGFILFKANHCNKYQLINVNEIIGIEYQ